MLPWTTGVSPSCWFAQEIPQEEASPHVPHACNALKSTDILLLSMLQVVHRDIKSGNVLLSRDYSQAKICDVGLAHIMGTTTNTGHGVQATFAYAAPEMLFNKK